MEKYDYKVPTDEADLLQGPVFLLISRLCLRSPRCRAAFLNGVLVGLALRCLTEMESARPNQPKLRTHWSSRTCDVLRFARRVNLLNLKGYSWWKVLLWAKGQLKTICADSGSLEKTECLEDFLLDMGKPSNPLHNKSLSSKSKKSTPKSQSGGCRPYSWNGDRRKRTSQSASRRYITRSERFCDVFNWEAGRCPYGYDCKYQHTLSTNIALPLSRTPHFAPRA